MCHNNNPVSEKFHISRRNKKACLKQFASRPKGMILEALTSTET